MEIRSRTIRIIESPANNIRYYDWVIIRGPGILAREHYLSHYNDSQLILGVF